MPIADALAPPARGRAWPRRPEPLILHGNAITAGMVVQFPSDVSPGQAGPGPGLPEAAPVARRGRRHLGGVWRLRGDPRRPHARAGASRAPPEAARPCRSSTPPPSRNSAGTYPGAVLGMGTLDGVHVGHQAILRRVAERASAVGRYAGGAHVRPAPAGGRAAGAGAGPDHAAAAQAGAPRAVGDGGRGGDSLHAGAGGVGGGGVRPAGPGGRSRGAAACASDTTSASAAGGGATSELLRAARPAATGSGWRSYRRWRWTVKS